MTKTQVFGWGDDNSSELMELGSPWVGRDLRFGSVVFFWEEQVLGSGRQANK